jgi:hypothetical protein
MATFSQRQTGADNSGNYAGSWITNSWILVGWNNFLSAQNRSAWRYTSVTIPQGSTINSASITLTAQTTESDTVDTRIRGIAEDNTADMSTDPASRTKTTAAVSKNNTGITNNATYIYDVTAIVQEIVNRGGWGSSNAMGFYLDLNSGASGSTHWNHFHGTGTDATKSPLLDVDYTAPTHEIDTSLLYRVRKQVATPITKLLRYVITDPETSPVPFLGIKIAKSGHNVLNTKNPNNLKFSSDYNTLKYFVDGHASIHVVSGVGEFYNSVGFFSHNLGYYPFAEVYAKDDLMSAYSPLGRLQAGSGAYRQFFFYVTTTKLYVVANGFTSVSSVDYTVDFYYKIFKNNLNL